VLAALMTSSAVAFAATSRYSDVSDTSPFLADIEWLAGTGITKGCTTDEFCPQDNVTREQMAAFLHRLATSRAVDAFTVQGLTPADLQGQTGPAGPTGAQGIQGIQGIQGAKGDTGDTGVVNVLTVSSAATGVAALATVDVSANCAATDLVTGGGFLSANPALVVLGSYPSDADTWTVRVTNTDTSSHDITVYARCADITP
jgi:hypothetical protein